MKWKLLIVLLLSFFLLAACNEKQPDQKAEATEPKKVENASVEKQDKQEVIFEVPGADAPSDQGDVNVWYRGGVSLEGRKLRAVGTSNLLPESKLYFHIEGIGAGIIGGMPVAFTDDNGNFVYETELPEKFNGLFTLEIRFEPAIQNEEIRMNYGESGEKLTGNFVRTYDNGHGEDFQKASVILELTQENEQEKVTIEEPVWEVPADYGSTDVRIEPTISKDHRYIYIDGKSNLLEGTQMRSTVDLPGYITSGFVGISYVNPDGSFRVVFNNPESDERIQSLTNYKIILEPDAWNSRSSKVAETYGENGEKFTGELVVQNGNKKRAQFIMKVKAD